jgi:hypothetical protein
MNGNFLVLWVDQHSAEYTRTRPDNLKFSVLRMIGSFQFDFIQAITGLAMENNDFVDELTSHHKFHEVIEQSSFVLVELDYEWTAPGREENGKPIASGWSSKVHNVFPYDDATRAIRV